MNRPELDEFAALWQGDPDPLEQAQMEAYARRAARRGRLIDYLDYAVWISLFGSFVAGAFVSHSLFSILLAVPLMLAVTWMTWRRRSLRQMARTLDTADRGSFLQTSLRNARANLRRNTIGLVSLPFVVPAALIFKVSVRSGGGPAEVWAAFLVWAHTPRAPIGIVLLLVLAGFTLRARRKTKVEIERLEALRQGYEVEAEWERGA